MNLIKKLIPSRLLNLDFEFAGIRLATQVMWYIYEYDEHRWFALHVSAWRYNIRIILGQRHIRVPVSFRLTDILIGFRVVLPLLQIHTEQFIDSGLQYPDASFTTYLKFYVDFWKWKRAFTVGKKR